MRARLSILDLAPLGRRDASDSFATSVALAQRAEVMGYERIWYAEHHNIPTIASSPTSALIALWELRPARSAWVPAPRCSPLFRHRTEFQPSERRDRPYVMVGVNVLAADTTVAANAQLKTVSHARAVGQFVRQFGLAGPDVSDEQADEIPAAGAAPHVDESLTYTAAGTPSDVRDSLDKLLRLTDADELISVHPPPSPKTACARSLLAEAAH